MKLHKFIKAIKEDKTKDSRGQIIKISSSIHQKMKQTSFFYDIPLNKLANSILNQWLMENTREIIEDKIKSLKDEADEYNA
ncbi:MAG: hypothetical protein F9K09_04270 [Flavobacteriales bacterium]|nr:MAG: hypothetical protein F9K09_04270 [Flavobacteriales bacterium]